MGMSRLQQPGGRENKNKVIWWIETVYNVEHYGESMSHPMRVRGLKQSLKYTDCPEFQGTFLQEIKKNVYFVEFIKKSIDK
ncbi:hypothetical protein AGMMS50230_15300 [Spirochaetia bacterium]|nr:hypothetical protein AGMMS50230_15300 [Spirochaetia bacterium]